MNLQLGLVHPRGAGVLVVQTVMAAAVEAESWTPKKFSPQHPRNATAAINKASRNGVSSSGSHKNKNGSSKRSSSAAVNSNHRAFSTI